MIRVDTSQIASMPSSSSCEERFKIVCAGELYMLARHCGDACPFTPFLFRLWQDQRIRAREMTLKKELSSGRFSARQDNVFKV